MMAKDKDPTPESKSTAIPGGTKASDLPSSVGGTKGTERAGTPSQPVNPVNPANPSGPNQPTVDTTPPFTHALPDHPGDDTLDTPDAPKSGPALQPRKGFHTGSETVPARGGFKGGPSDETSVRQFIDLNKQFVQAVRARDLSSVMTVGGAIITVFADLFGSESFSLFGVTAEDAKALDECDKVTHELDSCRNELSTWTASGRRVPWTGGGEAHPDSGSPQPMGKMTKSDEAVKTLDPMLLLKLFEVAQAIWAAFLKIRDR